MPFSLSPESAHRVLRDLIAGRLGPRRKLSRQELDLPPGARLDEPPAGMDSLEALEIAGAVNEMFELHRTGLEDNLLRYRTLDRWIDVVVRSWDAHPEAIVFRTSGSTGDSKKFRHPAAVLARETEVHAKQFGGRRRIVAFPPAHHIYGFLFTALLPERLGAPVLEGWRLGAGALAKALRPGDLVVGFPTIWRYLSVSLAAWPEDVRGVTSTGPMDPGVVRDLRESGLSGMTEIFGSSETGGIGARDSSEGTFRLFDFWRRGDEASLLRTGPGGVEGEAVPVPDRLEWESERTFRPAGRRDGAVAVGGVNVVPGVVAAGLREHPGVRDCAVRPFRDGGETRLKAFIVPEESVSPDSLREELRKWIAGRFSAPERPVRLDVGERLPRNEMGKVSDWGVDNE
jgi:4-coumarate--CoA ligase